MILHWLVAGCALLSQTSAAAQLNRDPDSVAPGGDVGPAGGAAPRAVIEVVVGSRETLGAIARRHGVSLEALCAANGITNPDRVRAGRRLRIPAASSPGLAVPAAPVPAAPPAPVAAEAPHVVATVRQAADVRAPERRMAPGMAHAARQVVSPPRKPTAAPSPRASVPDAPASPFDGLATAEEPREPAPQSLLTDVYGLRELARAPETSRRHTRRAAPAVPRPPVGAARFERFGAMLAEPATARRAAQDVFATPPQR